jgi:hypothetical protein
MDSATPVVVATPAKVTRGDDATCARLVDGTVACWGNGSSGALGRGDTTSSGTPGVVGCAP